MSRFLVILTWLGLGSEGITEAREPGWSSEWGGCRGTTLSSPEKVSKHNTTVFFVLGQEKVAIR